MVVKTFRGLLSNSTQEQIRLQTIKGKVGYRITKFKIMPNTPGSGDFEGVVKIYKTNQTTFDATIDFTDSDLLAAAYYQDNAGEHYPSSLDIIMDQVLFNQDIYVTYVYTTGSQKANYYIELETLPLDDKGAEYTTIKDLRSRGF